MKPLFFIFLLSLFSAAQAQNIYKSVDAEGKVTYSSSIPDKAGNVEILPPTAEPSAEAVAAARQQQSELEQALKERAEKRENEELQRQQAQSEKRANKVVERRYTPFPIFPVPRVIQPRAIPPQTLPANTPAM